jgi:hypothetical protein
MQPDIKSFPLLHVLLYAKNWYHSTGDIWQDLALCIEKDMMTPYEDPFRERRYITELISSKLIPYLSKDVITTMLDNFSPDSCWKVGFYTKDHMFAKTKLKPDETLPTYEYWQAVVKSFLSQMRCMDIATLGITGSLPEPTILELYKGEETLDKFNEYNNARGNSNINKLLNTEIN